MSLSLKLTCLCVFVGIVYAVEKPCCLSKKWNGKMKITTSYIKNGSTIPTVTDTRLMIDHDLDMKMERVFGSIHSDGPMGMTAENYTDFYDFGNRKSYELDSDWSHCKVTMLEPGAEMSQYCVPKTLRLYTTYTIGSGPEALHVNSWEGMYENFYYRMQTSVNDCTPVSVTITGMTPDGYHVVQTILYADVVQNHLSGNESNVFRLPDSCMMTGMPIGK